MTTSKLRISAAFLAFVLMSACAGSGDEAKEDASRPLEGVWRVVAANLEGKQLTGKQLRQVTRFFVFVRGEQITISGDQIGTISKYAVDLSKLPHTLDTTDGRGFGGFPDLPTLSIYKIENSQLTIRSAEAGDRIRPGGFDLHAGQKGIRMVLERARPVGER